MKKRPSYFLITTPIVAILAMIAVIASQLLTGSIIATIKYLSNTFDYLKEEFKVSDSFVSYGYSNS